MNIPICDLCGERYPKHRIQMTHRPNDEAITVEYCDTCLEDIAMYLAN